MEIPISPVESPFSPWLWPIVPSQKHMGDRARSAGLSRFCLRMAAAWGSCHPRGFPSMEEPKKTSKTEGLEHVFYGFYGETNGFIMFLSFIKDVPICLMDFDGTPHILWLPSGNQTWLAGKYTIYGWRSHLEISIQFGFFPLPSLIAFSGPWSWKPTVLGDNKSPSA